jgi:transposase-like protein
MEKRTMTTKLLTATHVGDHGGMADPPDPEVPDRARRRTFTARYKLNILGQYEAMDSRGRAALLRREGLYSSSISEWRRQRDEGALEGLSAPRGRPQVNPLERRVARLEQANRRLNGDLDKARKVIAIQGKLSELLEQLATESQDDDSEQTR